MYFGLIVEGTRGKGMSEYHNKKKKKEIEEYLREKQPEMLEWAKMVAKRSRKIF